MMPGVKQKQKELEERIKFLEGTVNRLIDDTISLYEKVNKLNNENKVTYFGNKK